MCGRYTLITPNHLAERFELTGELPHVQPSYNVAPGQSMPVVTGHSPRHLALMRWGLVPFWAKDEKIGFKMINARAEGIDAKPAFRAALKTRHCLVPATGYYEWKQEGASKVPYLFTLKDQELFSFAGLYETWTDLTGATLRTYTIITTAPNALAAKVHNRMPAILRREDEAAWLDPAVTASDQITGLLRSYAAEAMQSYAVSTQVGSPAQNDASLIVPATELLRDTSQAALEP